MAAQFGCQWYQLPVEFTNVSFKRLTPLAEDSEAKLTVRMLAPTGEFVVLEGQQVAVTGTVSVPEGADSRLCLADDGIQIKNDIWKGHKLDTNDFYTELNVRGFDYGPKFRQIQELQYDTFSKSYARVKLDTTGAIAANWISFVESLIQLYITHTTSRGVYVVQHMPYLCCDPRMLFGAGSAGDDSSKSALVVTDSKRKSVISNGIELKRLTFAGIPLRNVMHEVQMEKYEWVPHTEDQAIEAPDAQRLRKYISDCNLLVDKISDSLGADYNQTKRNLFIKSDDKRNSLSALIARLSDTTGADEEVVLRLLFNLHNTLFDENGNSVGADSKAMVGLCRKFLADNGLQYDLSLDLLNKVHSNGRLMRSVLDIVNENNQRQIAVAELNIGRAIMAPAVLYNMGFFFHYPLVVVICYRWPLQFRCNLRGHLDDIYRDRVGDVATASFEALVADMAGSVKESGFLFAVFRTQLAPADSLLFQLSDINISNKCLNDRLNSFIKYAQQNHFSAVSRKSDGIASTALLFRKCAKQSDPSGQAVVDVKFGKYDEWVEELKSRFVEYKDRPKTDNVWLFANDSDLNGIIGLVNCLRQEPGGDRFRCIVTDDPTVGLPIDFTVEPFNTILRNDLVMNVLRGESWGSYRLLNLERGYNERQTSRAYLDVTKKGDLNSIQWLLNLERGYNERQTSRAYLDVTKKGDLNSIQWYNLSTGAVGQSATSASKHVATGANGTVNVQIYYSGVDHKDLALASGQLGSEYVNKVFGFDYGGRREDTGARVMGISGGKSIATSIEASDRVLIPVPDNWSIEDGVSAISAYFAVWYSLINRAQIEGGETILIHSGTDSTGLAAIQVAKGLSCRVLTTASTPEKRQFLTDTYGIPVNCIYDPNDTSISEQILAATDGTGVDAVLNALSGEKLTLAAEVLGQYGRWVDLDNYDNRSIKPLPRVVYGYDVVERAFKQLSSGQTIGKVLVKVREEEPFNKITTDIKAVNIVANTRSWFDANKVYVLVGGLGGLGLEVAYWLVARGARKLVCVSRSGIKNDYQYVFVKRVETEATGGVGGSAQVKISTSDPSSIAGAEKLIAEAQSMGPLGGIFHFATVLADAFIGDQTAATFRKVCAPKVDALGYLDAVCRKFCPDMDYFVAFSSQSSGRGFVGQNNYGYANAVMERICERRQRDGLPGLAIQYGPIGDVGLWAANDNIDLTSIGMVINTQRIPSCLEVMDRFLSCGDAVVSTIVRREGAEQSGGSAAGAKNTVWQGIGIDMSSLPDDLTLGDVGMESILAVEMQQRIDREYSVSLTTDHIKLITVRMIKDFQNSDQKIVSAQIAEFKKSLKK
ncbi:unnamed protein product [Medioppia subpectinata]|uniref:Carrier domain-containing protein n=1 Tax=Medioppia subpectinata TaxID=1979941 RepID=A0A7R9KW74_9ACAR|nr:unnamed protein product [Medioppia subpectinata]CAG2111003.1 unnamed protein product [Medioppia subpectinata]